MDRPLAYPGFWMAAVLALVAVVIQTLLSVPLALIDEVCTHMLHLAPPQLAGQPVVIGLVNIIAFGVAIALGLAPNRLPLSRAFRFARPTILQLAAMALTVVGADLLLSELDNLFRSIAPPPEWLIEAFRTLISPEGSLPGRIFLLVVVAPVTEELLFRGVILRGLLSRYPAWVAVGLAAFLFAVVHLNPWQSVSAFWLGVAFGWFYLRSGSVTIPILAHAASNGLFVVLTSGLVDIPGLTGGLDRESASFQPWWLDLAGAVLLLAGLASFVNLTPRVGTTPEPEPPVMPLPSGVDAEQSQPPVIPPSLSNRSPSEGKGVSPDDS